MVYLLAPYREWNVGEQHGLKPKMRRGRSRACEIGMAVSIRRSPLGVAGVDEEEGGIHSGREWPLCRLLSGAAAYLRRLAPELRCQLKRGASSRHLRFWR